MAALSHKKPATTKSLRSISPVVTLSFFHTGVSIAGLQLLSRLAGHEKVSCTCHSLSCNDGTLSSNNMLQVLARLHFLFFTRYHDITLHYLNCSWAHIPLRWERQLTLHCALSGINGEQEYTEQAKQCGCLQVIRKAKPNIFWKQQLICSGTQHTQTYSATGITNNRLCSLLVIRGQIIPQYSIQWIFGQYNRKSHTLWTL